MRRGGSNILHQGAYIHTLAISRLSFSIVSLRYFFTSRIVATSLALSVWMSCSGDTPGLSAPPTL